MHMSNFGIKKKTGRKLLRFISKIFIYKDIKLRIVTQACNPSILESHGYS